jgi:hypothetical protein
MGYPLNPQNKMVNSNEQALLTYLEELRTKTQSSLTMENGNLWYWKSGNHFQNDEFKNLTNSQVDFFITNTENRIKPLRFRLEWLDTQISNLQSLISLTQPNNQATTEEFLNHLFNKK